MTVMWIGLVEKSFENERNKGRIYEKDYYSGR